MINGIPYIDSRTIAKQLGRRHDNLIRDIKRIIEDKELILENSNVSSLYLSSTYRVEGQNRKYNNYLIQRDGFVLLMFDVQGNRVFKMNYIEKFNLMEETLKKITAVANDVGLDANEARSSILATMNDYDNKVKGYEKKLAEVSLFHKREIEMKEVYIKELQDKNKAYKYLEDFTYDCQNGCMPLGISSEMKDKILMMANAITQSGYYINKNKNKSWRNIF